VKLRLYLLYGCAAACHGMACVFYAARNYTECFNKNISLARFSAGSLMKVEDRNILERYLCVF